MTAVVVPEGLHPGPEVDGQATWYGPSCIPYRLGWEARVRDPGEFEPVPGSMAAGQIVQCRPKRLPDPDGLPVVTPPGTPWRISTTVDQVSDRPDADQWEYADTDGRWLPLRALPERMAITATPDDFPIVVRRRL